MGRPRSLRRSISVGAAGRRHTCKSNESHVLLNLKGDRMLVVKIECDDHHYCVR